MIPPATQLAQGEKVKTNTKKKEGLFILLFVHHIPSDPEIFFSCLYEMEENGTYHLSLHPLPCVCILYSLFHGVSMCLPCTLDAVTFPIHTFKLFNPCSRFSSGSLVSPLGLQSSRAQWGWLRGPGAPSTHVSSKASLFATASSTGILNDVSFEKNKKGQYPESNLETTGRKRDPTPTF